MPPTRISQSEFIALLAMLFATIAFSIDAMLPAMGEIGQELTPSDPNKAQLIITSFVFGMGTGTFFAGPLSDAFGRKPVIIGGAVLYCIGAALAWAAQSLELALAARVLQGLGSAGPRVVSLAIIRDLYSGRQMARIVSLVMLIFTLAPAFAPSIGAVLIGFSGWRSIFLAFIVFSVLSAVWLKFRVPETLPPEKRQPLQLRVLWSAVREVATHRVVAMTIAAQTLSFGCLFAVLSSIQPVFEITFGRGEHFHLWFMLTAVIASSASILNAQVVVRLGMRRMVRAALVMEILGSGIFVIGIIVGWPDALYFPACFLWLTSVFFMVGLTIGNLNAIALEPMGHIAGTAASVIGAISTVGSVLLAIPVALSFDGTPLPLAASVLIFSTIGYGVMLKLGTRGEGQVEPA